MNKNKSRTIADRANQFFYEHIVHEDFISAPQPKTDFDPFAPNYGNTQQSVKLHVGDEKKPMETDVTKDVDNDIPDTADKDDSSEKGNRSLVLKMYKEMGTLVKEVNSKLRVIENKFVKINSGLDTAPGEKVTELDGISTQLYGDIEKFNDIVKDVVDALNSVDLGGKTEELPTEVVDKEGDHEEEQEEDTVEVGEE